jgi:formylglycine-generating enzyme required for sulfatase activity
MKGSMNTSSRFIRLLAVLLASSPGWCAPEIFAAVQEFQQPNAYAVVVGISQYSEEVIPRVPYAVKDAQAITALLETQAGIPKTHIKLLTDSKATLSGLRNHLGEWLRMRVKADSTVYVYFAGHGTPNLQTQSGAIVPWDGHPDFPAGLYPLKELEDTLGALPTKNVIVFLDSCFSGGAGRSVLPKGARPMGLQYPVLSHGDVMVLAAATGTQISSDYDKAQHGLFTHYLLAGLRGEADADKDQVVTLRELVPFVKERVAHTAVEELNREQTPMLLPGEEALKARSGIPLARVVPSGEANPSPAPPPAPPQGIEVARAPAYQAPPVTLPKEMTGRDGAPMALVPAGEFLMGSAADGPEHRVYLDSFYMDKFEVTAARYAKFMGETSRAQPFFWEEVNLKSDGERPVIGVDWHDADAYCKWAGKRLPTEAEWEKAARGTDKRTYPWGSDDPSSQLANYSVDGKRAWQGMSTLSPVGSFEEGKSPYGLYDMAGNVWEWVADWYDASYYRFSPDRNPPGPSKGPMKSIRGGAWLTPGNNMRMSRRNFDPPVNRFLYVGFRCAQSAAH